jgi:hypothetical protein
MVYFLFVPGIADGYAFKKGDQNGYGVGEGYGNHQIKGSDIEAGVAGIGRAEADEADWFFGGKTCGFLDDLSDPEKLLVTSNPFSLAPLIAEDKHDICFMGASQCCGEVCYMFSIIKRLDACARYKSMSASVLLHVFAGL